MTHKQEIFILEYQKDFNATQAAIRAGYSAKTAYSIGQRLLKNVEIQNYLRTQKEKLIADKSTRQIFWTRVMNEDSHDMKDRLKASELLGKSQGDFIISANIQTSNYDLSKLSKEELITLKNLAEKATPKS